jgi:hypothetical protein
LPDVLSAGVQVIWTPVPVDEVTQVAVPLTSVQVSPLEQVRFEQLALVTTHVATPLLISQTWLLAQVRFEQLALVTTHVATPLLISQTSLLAQVRFEQLALLTTQAVPLQLLPEGQPPAHPLATHTPFSHEVPEPQLVQVLLVPATHTPLTQVVPLPQLLQFELMPLPLPGTHVPLTQLVPRPHWFKQLAVLPPLLPMPSPGTQLPLLQVVPVPQVSPQPVPSLTASQTAEPVDKSHHVPVPHVQDELTYVQVSEPQLVGEAQSPPHSTEPASETVSGFGLADSPLLQPMAATRETTTTTTDIAESFIMTNSVS